MKSLFEEILSSRENYRTDSYSMSIGELINMYKSKELITNPIYQREFRWSDLQRSRFIESILLEIPLPSIFVYQDRNKWEVIDGLQRLSTIFQFTGVLLDEKEELIKSFKIEDVKTLKIVNGMSWEDFDEDTKFDFRKAKIEIKIIKDNSIHKSKAKFELFQRINQKPSILSGQEFRNALFIMYDDSIYFWLNRLSKYVNFTNCITGLEERWIKEQYDKELVLRLFVFPYYDLKSKYKNVDEYLDRSIFYEDQDSMIQRINSGEFNLDEEEYKFKKTFDLLYTCYGFEVFKSKTSSKGQQFLESLYEAIAIGLYYNISQYDESDIAVIKLKINELEEQPGFKEARGIGTNTEVRIRKLVPFSKIYFSKNEQKEQDS